MKCEFCRGEGFIRTRRDTYSVSSMCRECLGSGVGHCCDGLQEQPEAETEVGGLACPQWTFNSSR